jgi:hypothetical protein
MANGFEIQVPITIKGGREGERVGLQMGEKIASQIKKSLKAVGVGGGQAGGGAGNVAGMMGVSSGLKGVVGKLGVIGLAIGAAVGFLAQSSPYLKGILSIFGRAFMIFFRPFGDFLATLLRPLAILMMKMAVAFLKWTRPLSGKVGEAMKDVPQFGTTGNMLVDIPAQIANWALQVGAAIGAVALEIGKGAFELGTKIGQWLYDKVILPAGTFIAEKILDAFAWVRGIGSTIWNEILRPAWQFLSSVGQWIWNQIILPAWMFLANVGQWIWNQILLPAWNFLKEVGKWIWDQILKPGLLFLSDLGSKIWNFVKGLFQGTIDVVSSVWGFIKSLFKGSISADSVWSFIKNLFGSGGSKKGYAMGTSFVPETGMYQLHRGEQVIPKNQTSSRSIIFRPTFQINGNVTKDIDVDAIVRRAGRMTEMELKQRGII